MPPKNLIPFTSLDREVKQLIGRSWSTMTYRRWIKDGVRGRVLPSRLVAGSRYILDSDLATFLQVDDARVPKGKRRKARGGNRG
ncbi:hypothetical protein Pla52o_39360 [Novipirellula galeiformis]|uniref:Uncharacterized protein n=1 Tax=Novipirellula galeiformis TaxID=2528004 RepID=A0A5C6CG96_9BACT|nr:hypothetical protein [Novipirellula galeiformis]TWU21749.1 hypothetical protein Pla52o_39360 [Novipirellula galeiformis]